MRKIILFLLVFYSLFPIYPQIVKIADDEAEWPPFLYYYRENGEVVDKTRYSGPMVKILDLIFERIDLKYQIDLLPWIRAVQYVQEGKEYEVLINVSVNKKRLEDFWVTAPVYEGHRVIFYSQKRFPQKLDIKAKKDLAQYRFIGVHGYNYEHILRLDDQIIINTSPRSMERALSMISSGHGDLFPASYEVAVGGAMIGHYTIPEDIAYFPDIWNKPLQFYIMISKKSPRALSLYSSINQAIIALHHNGEIEEILKNSLSRF